jgi:hypothetical protein
MPHGTLGPATTLALAVALSLVTPAGGTLKAQASRGAPAGATVGGVVRDSLSGGVLAGAVVQLAAGDDPTRYSRSVTADAQGRFAVDGVPPGRYTLGFLHPVLDSLGIEPPVRAVAVGDAGVTADLALPSASRLRGVICRNPAAAEAPPAASQDSSAVLVGVVRQASDGAPAGGVALSGEWLELTIARSGLAQRRRRLVATTGDDGWFALCNVPRDGALALQAGRGADSTALLDLHVPASGFLHRVLYLGASRVAVAAADASPAAPGAVHTDSGAVRARRVLLGDGRLGGTVLAAAAGTPLAGAVVRLVNGPETRTDARGEWTLADLPAGTRMLEVRAVGFYPERRAVDVVGGAPPVRVALSTFRAVMDTVRVTAARAGDTMAGFMERRRRGGGGRYLGPEDIARRQPNVTTDLLRNVAGLRLEGYGQGAHFTMRGGMTGFGTGGEDRCVPEVYIDGVHVAATPDDLDTWIRARDIKGIEVYPDATVPPQFRQPMQTCGSVVIWTR